MFNHILIPVDFSEQTLATVHLAQRMASLDGGHLTLLHVIELIADSSPEGELKGFYKELEAQAQRKFEALLAEATEDGYHIASTIRYGNRVEEILAYADENNVNLIVMLSHKIDPADPTQHWGTISQKIGLLAQCPVLLVR
jgi:universal stress protein A